MKRWNILILVIMVALFNASSIQACPKLEKQVDVEYLENGDYVETVIEETVMLGRVNTRKGNKTSSYKNSAGEVMWSITVTGTFSYTSGKSVKCTSSSGTSKSNSSTWKVSQASASKSGNKASASATGTQIVNGVTISTLSRTVTLSCDSYGNLS